MNMMLLKQHAEAFITHYKEEKAEEIAEAIPLKENDVVLKILATSPKLFSHLQKKVHGGIVIPFHHDEKKLEGIKTLEPATATGKMDEKFIHPSWKKDKQENAVLFAFTLPLVDTHTGLYTACRILRESRVETAHIICLQWKEEFMRKHDELQDIPFIGIEEYETFSYELGLQEMEVTEHDDFFTVCMEFPKIQFQDDWSAFAGDA